MITGGNYEPFETINPTSKYKELIAKFKDRHPGLIDQFKDAFVLFHKDTTYNEYQQGYSF